MPGTSTFGGKHLGGARARGRVTGDSLSATGSARAARRARRRVPCAVCLPAHAPQHAQMWSSRAVSGDPAPTTIIAYSRAQALRAFFEGLRGAAGVAATGSAAAGEPAVVARLLARIQRLARLHASLPTPTATLPPRAAPPAALELARLHGLLIHLVTHDTAALPAQALHAATAYLLQCAGEGSAACAPADAAQHTALLAALRTSTLAELHARIARASPAGAAAALGDLLELALSCPAQPETVLAALAAARTVRDLDASAAPAAAAAAVPLGAYALAHARASLEQLADAAPAAWGAAAQRSCLDLTPLRLLPSPQPKDATLRVLGLAPSPDGASLFVALARLASGRLQALLLAHFPCPSAASSGMTSLGGGAGATTPAPAPGTRTPPTAVYDVTAQFSAVLPGREDPLDPLQLSFSALALGGQHAPVLLLACSQLGTPGLACLCSAGPMVGQSMPLSLYAPKAATPPSTSALLLTDIPCLAPLLEDGAEGALPSRMHLGPLVCADTLSLAQPQAQGFSLTGEYLNPATQQPCTLQVIFLAGEAQQGGGLLLTPLGSQERTLPSSRPLRRSLALFSQRSSLSAPAAGSRAVPVDFSWGRGAWLAPQAGAAPYVSLQVHGEAGGAGSMFVSVDAAGGVSTGAGEALWGGWEAEGAAVAAGGAGGEGGGGARAVGGRARARAFLTLPALFPPAPGFSVRDAAAPNAITPLDETYVFGPVVQPSAGPGAGGWGGGGGEAGIHIPVPAAGVLLWSFRKRTEPICFCLGFATPPHDGKNPWETRTFFSVRDHEFLSRYNAGNRAKVYEDGNLLLTQVLHFALDLSTGAWYAKREDVGQPQEAHRALPWKLIATFPNIVGKPIVSGRCFSSHSSLYTHTPTANSAHSLTRARPPPLCSAPPSSPTTQMASLRWRPLPARTRGTGRRSLVWLQCTSLPSWRWGTTPCCPPPLRTRHAQGWGRTCHF